jgi:hypothetical protein
MNKQVFCIDTDGLEPLLSDQRPIEGMLYDVERETELGYFLKGFDTDPQFINNEYKALYFKKERFLVFNGKYDVDEFNIESDSYLYWGYVFNKEGLSDYIKPDNLFFDEE